MNFKKYWKRAALLGTLVLALGVVAGCGGDDSADKATASNPDAKVVNVATRGTSKPFSYTNDDGTLTGYDVEILKEVERRDPSLKFNFKPMSVDAAFVAMDAGQVDMIANQMRNNPQRAAKYIITKEINNYTDRRLVVKKGRTDIHSLKDLEGKNVVATTNSEFADLLKQYNETAATPINIIYTDKASVETLNLVATGRADAAGEYDYIITTAQKERNLPVEAVGDTLTSVPTYFVVRKDPEMQKVADKIDAQVKAMREDGTLKKLSEQYLGGDYTVEPAKK
ncbi:transporter substrate-binding domain-containing protein [Veillonella sp.]|uniref:transporter substrate-binding domain-containing protein n=1 Tax=Veillonella sp. TaxID=1926307 RepID=UPI0025DD0E22|nr:transporter substrate-binding domain-containing protein [Veillonella sp.]